MEWLSTNITSPNAGPVTATVVIRNPFPSFLQAVQMSALYRLTMPIDNHHGLTGYVVKYGWEHDGSPINAFSTSTTTPSIILIIEYVVVP